MNVHVSGERALIAAILLQAFCDAMSHDPKAGRFTARNFLDNVNKLFRIYCELIDLDPIWTARSLQRRIRKHDLKELEQFRD